MASSVSIVENGLSSSAPVSSASSPNNKNTSNANTSSTAHRHSHSSATPSSPLARVNSMSPSSSLFFENIARMPRINPYFNRKVSGLNGLQGNNKNGVYDKKGGGMLPPVTAIVSMENINGSNRSSHDKGDLSGNYGKRSPLAKLSLPPCTTNEDPTMHSSGSEKNCSMNGNATHPHTNVHLGHEDDYDDEDVMVNRTAPRITVPTPQSRGKPLHAIVCSSESSSPSSPPPVLSSMESYSSKGGSYLRVGVSAAEEGAAEGRGLECNKMPSFSCSGTDGAATVPPLTRNTQKQSHNDKLLSSTIGGTDSNNNNNNNNNNPKCIGAYPKRRSNDQWEDFLQTSFTSSNISASVNLGSMSTASASLTDSVMNAGGAGGGSRSRTASGSTGTRLKVSRNNKGELVDANSSASSSRAATDEPRPLSRHSSSLTVEQLAALRRTPSFRSRQHSPPPMMLSLGSSGFPSPSGTNTVQVLRRRRRDPGSAPLDDEEGDIFSREGGKGGGGVQRNTVEFPATPRTSATTMDAVIISREALLNDVDAPANIVKTQNKEGQKGSNTLKPNHVEKTPTHAGGDGLYSECDVTYSADGYSTSLALPPGATPVSTVAAAARRSSIRDEPQPEVVLSTVSEASIATSDSTPRTLLATHNAAPTQPGTSTEAEVDKEVGGGGGETIALVPSPPTSRRTSARSKRKQVGVFCLDEDDDPFDVTAAANNHHDTHNNTTSKPAEDEAIAVGIATASPASEVGQEAAPAPFISIKADIPFNTDSTQARASDSSEDDEEESDALLDGFRPEGFAARRGARSKNSIVFFLTSEESPTATAEEINTMDDEKKKKDILSEHLPRPPLVKTTGYLCDPFFPSPPMPTKSSSSLATNSWRSLFEGHCSRPTEDTTTTTSTYTTPKQQQQTSMPLPEHPLPQLQAVSILLGSSSKYAADPAKMQRPEENTFGRRRRNRYSRQCTTEEDDEEEEEEGNYDEGPDSRECDTGDDYEWYWEEIEEEGDNGDNDEEQEEEEDS